MNTKTFRIMVVFVALISVLGRYTPGRATSEAALTPAQTINIAYFYKPPNMDAASAAKNFSTMVLTNGDYTYRDQLKANGFSSTIPEYFRSEAIQDPGSCTATPLNNQVAYKPGDFCSISQNHPDWFLLDSSGRRITVTSGGNYYRMDPANAGWRDFFVTRVVESQNQDGWSALFLDNVEASLGKFFGNNPAKYPNDASYQAAVAGFLQYLDVNYSQKYGRPFFGNIVALGSTDAWFNYLQYLDGALTERFAVAWDESSYLSASKWEADMTWIEQTQAQGKYAILVSPGYQSDLNRENFAFASYLLISNGKAAFRYAKFSAYRETWLYDNYKVNLGSPLGPRYLVGSVWRRDFSNGYVSVDPVNHSAAIVPTTKTTAAVYISGNLVDSYTMTNLGSIRDSYSGIDDGPVKVVSATGSPIIASLRDLWSDGTNESSYSQLMGLPASQLSTTYVFPAYNNVSLDEQIRFGNVGNTATTVTVTIGGVLKGSYSLQPSESRRVSYDGLDAGPVVVQSSGNVPIIASIRDSWWDGNKWSSYSQLMGLPGKLLSTTYVFPAYNNVSLDEQIRFGNVGNTATTVTVTIGGVLKGSYPLQPSESRRVSYDGLDAGPVVVQSSRGVPIIVSIRDSWWDGNKWSSYSQLMGLPANLLSGTYWFPIYDNVSADAQLRFGNVGNAPTTITVSVAGSIKGTYNLNPSQSIRVYYSNLNNGPLVVQSSNGVPIIASIRDSLWDGSKWSSYSQLMGLPASQLSNTYVFPAYNNVTYDNELRIAVP